MVAALNVRLLSNVDAAQLVQRFVTQVDSESLSLGDDEVIAKLMGQIRETLPTFQKSLNQVKGSSDSAKLSQLDRLRDQTLQLLFMPSVSIAMRRTRRRSAPTRTSIASLKPLSLLRTPTTSVSLA